MILTRIELDPLNRQTMRAMVNPNLIHGAITSCLPQKTDRVLWRIDQIGGKDFLLILSQNNLDFSSVQKQFGYEECPIQSVDYNILLNKITAGSKWQFKLAVNPVRNLKPKNDEVSKRWKVAAQIGVKNQKKWLIGQGDKNGFILEPDHFDIKEERWISFVKHQGSRQVTFLKVVFEGQLTVTDPEEFKKMLIQGIGREKAYGLGMLTIIPVRG